MTKFLEDLPEARPMPEAEAQAILRALRQEMTRRPWWRRRLVVASIGLGTALATAGAMTAYVAFREPTERGVATCYGAAATGSDTVRVDVALASPNESGSAVIEDPIQLCAQAWRDGLLDAGVVDSPFGTQQVPELVACTLPGGSVGVFPGSAGTCQRLELPAMGQPSP